MHEGRLVGKDGEGGGFRPGQVPARTVEVPPGCRLDADDVSAERCVRRIQRKYFFFCITQLERDGEKGFADFPPERSAPIVLRNTDGLHGERRAPRDNPSARYILPEGAGEREGVDSRMQIEPPVFEGDEGRTDPRRNCTCGKAPLAVGGHRSAEQLSPAVVDREGKRFVEPRREGRKECRKQDRTREGCGCLPRGNVHVGALRHVRVPERARSAG